MEEYAGFYHNTSTQRRLPKTARKRNSDGTRTSIKKINSEKSTNPRLEDDAFSMLGTPLLDYKLTANQTNKARAQQASRKLSTTSGGAFDRKNALQMSESRIGAATIAAARADAANRSSSISSATESSGLTALTWGDPPSYDELMARPFTRRNGRRYLRDTTLPYPLPCDLQEIHRQTLRTMLLCEVFNGPVCSPTFQQTPPKRVLEVGCGTGYWSVRCHQHFVRRGFSSISFTGIDIAPLAPRMDADDDMNWKFVQHDLRRVPLPFRNEEFNLIMIKDLSMVTSTTFMQQTLMDEYLRILKPGGCLEIWDSDHSLRALLQHASPPSTKEADDEGDTNSMGIYTLTTQTRFAAPHNTYLNDYSCWISKALEKRNLSPMACTTMLPTLHQESDILTDIDSRRLAIPLGEVRWEREGVGGAVIQGSNGHAILSKGKAKETTGRTLTPIQAALRRTALMTVIQMIESLEPMLKEASGKGQDEWDSWQTSMMKDLLEQNGTAWGECLEVGAFWARKKITSI